MHSGAVIEDRKIIKQQKFDKFKDFLNVTYIILDLINRLELLIPENSSCY